MVGMTDLKQVQEALETGLEEIKAYYGADTFGIVAMEVIGKALATLRKLENKVLVDKDIIQGILATLDYIKRADKTSQYEYEEPCADGRLTTVPGQKFLTPKELAMQELEYLDACGIQRREEE